ncbi:MBL fold metallo-hydrolase [Edwardsiella piscicida]|nr:MBL fold metallo-hydrolase [Edwardsiella piscicida]
MLPYLRWQGLRLSGIIISHADSDHAGGRRTLTQAYPLAWLASPAPNDLRAGAVCIPIGRGYGSTFSGRRGRWLARVTTTRASCVSAGRGRAAADGGH